MATEARSGEWAVRHSPARRQGRGCAHRARPASGRDQAPLDPRRVLDAIGDRRARYDWLRRVLQLVAHARTAAPGEALEWLEVRVKSTPPSLST